MHTLKNVAPVIWIIIAVLVLCAGLILIFNTTLAWSIIEWSVAALILAVGLIYLFSVFIKTTEQKLKALGIGALCVLGSAALFAMPRLIGGTFGLVSAVLAIIIGLLVLLNAFKLRRDGVVCTDWGITGDETGIETFAGKPWGAEELSVAERHYRILMAGVDQFGGNNDKGPVLEAYKMGVEEMGEPAMSERFETSAVRLLLNIFRTGLFENPYLDPAESQKIVGNPDFMKEAYDAQLASVVMLKNKGNALPMSKEMKVYIPKRYYPAVVGFFGTTSEAHRDDPVNLDLVRKYFTVVDNPDEADFAIVFMTSPNSGTGYDKSDREKGGNGYMPISLQYNDYTATYARNPSLAGGDPFENFTNRSYKGKSVKTANKQDMLSVLETKAKMKGKPVIVSLEMDKPTIMSEFEGSADAILVNFGVQNQAVLDIISGKAEPSALLPLQMPADMRIVEEQFEDVPRDMKCYTDSEGHLYDFAFGMNWKGVIDDERVTKYK